MYYFCHLLWVGICPFVIFGHSSIASFNTIMDFKESLKRFWMLVSDTSDTWSRLASQTGNTKAEDFRFLYSLLVINAVSALAGYALNGHTAISCILNAIFSPAAFYATVWILFLVVKKLNNDGNDEAGSEVTSSGIFRFIIYSSALNIVLNSFMLIFPGLFFLWILSLYTIYIVWEGLGSVMLIDDDMRTKPTAITTSIIIIAPALIMFLMHFIIPGAK